MADRITYQDFDLKISGAGDQYTAAVLRSPGGEGQINFSLPFSSIELENLILRMTRMRSARGKDSPEMEAARKLGEGLFQAVFQGEVGTCLVRSQDKITAQTGLRIRLRLQDAPELSDLPWEFLFDKDEGRFLAQSAYTPIVRYLEFGGSIQPLKVSLPLRILAVIANPSDYRPALYVKDEQDRLESALDELIRGELVKITWLQQATLDRLRRELRAEAYHVFHFIGHGGFERGSERGVLVFTDADGRSQEVDAERLGVMLRDHRSLRLAVLNACQGGRVTRSDPFSGVATNLVRQGIPAVVAMQFEISDPSARAFAGEFYAALAQGYPVDAAQAEARKAIYCLPEDVEWGTPVLYLRSDDGVLFDLGAPVVNVPADRGAERGTPAIAAQKETPAGQPREAGGDMSREQPEATEARGMDLPADLYAFEYLADNGVWISKYQVTNRQYQRFLDAADYAAQRFWVGFPRYGAPPKYDLQGDWGEEGWRWLLANFKGRTVENMRVEPRFWRNPRLGIQLPGLPVVGVTWYEAYAYCQWLHEHWAECEEAQHNPILPSFTLRLPLEAELDELSGYSKPPDLYTLGGERYEGIDIASLLPRPTTGRPRLGQSTLADWDSSGDDPLGSLTLGGENPLEGLDLASITWDWLANIHKRNLPDRVIYCPGIVSGELHISASSQRKPPVHFSDTLGFHIVFYPGAVEAASLQETRQSENLQEIRAAVMPAEVRQVAEPKAQQPPAASTDPEMVLPSDLYTFVYLPESKGWIGKYPVTNIQYQRFLEADDFARQDLWTGFPKYGEAPRCALIGDWGEEGWNWFKEALKDEQLSPDGKRLEPRAWYDAVFGFRRPGAPVVEVNWFEANAYCKWICKHWSELSEGKDNPDLVPNLIRLPTEQEWSAAAGGAYPPRRFPWDRGQQVTEKIEDIVRCANVEPSGIKCTTPVHMYPQGESLAGVWDMAGNVWEWQADIHPRFTSNLMLRGGCFRLSADEARLPSYGISVSPFRYLNNFGFRIFVVPMTN